SKGKKRNPGLKIPKA
nr:Chain B, Dual specificity mitogen-activated protein kinase kinase 6 [Homo sapiens]